MTIRAFGTDCAVTNTTISYADGRTKEVFLGSKRVRQQEGQR